MSRAVAIVGVLLAGCLQEIRAADSGLGGTGASDGPTFADAGSGADGSASNPVGCIRQAGDVAQISDPGGMDRFVGVRGLDFGPGHRLYVLNLLGPAPFSGYVHVFSPAPEHRLEAVLGRGVLGPVQHLTVAPDRRIIVVEYNSSGQGGPPEVIELDGNDNLLRRWTPSANNEAFSAAVNEAGEYLVGGFLVERYGSDRSHEQRIGVEGGMPGQMEVATDTEIGPDGFVWVADLFRNNIHQWHAETGVHVLEIGGRRNGEPGTFDNQSVPAGDFFGPEDIAFDSSGNLFANDPANSRIQKLTRQGSHLASFDFGGSRTIGPIAVEPSSGNLYVSRRTAIDILCAF